MNPRDIQPPFYRVAVKALVFDAQNKLLVGFKTDGKWEIPGGGLEVDETIENCLKREFQEELGIGIKSVGKISFAYRAQNPRGYYALRLAVPVELEGADFKYGELDKVRFVNRDELLQLDMEVDEAAIKDQVEYIWPVKP